MTIAAGTTLGRYEIRSKIGEGGMGEVYLAEDAQLRRRVALKISPSDIAANQDRMRRFVQEAQAVATLNHPNIAHIYEIGEYQGTDFIAMEFIDGQTLRERLRGLMKLTEVLEVAMQTANGSRLLTLNVNPHWDSIRSDFRFEELLRKIGLEK